MSIASVQGYVEKVQTITTAINANTNLQVQLAQDLQKNLAIHLKILAACGEKVLEQMQKPAPPRNAIVITSATYGHVACTAPSYASPDQGSCSDREKLTCDVLQNLKRRCSGLIKNVQLFGGAANAPTATTVIPMDKPLELKDPANTFINYVDYSETCQFQVNTQLCNAVDPAPEKKKALKLQYTCSNGTMADDGEVISMDTGIVTIGCPQQR